MEKFFCFLLSIVFLFSCSNNQQKETQEDIVDDSLTALPKYEFLSSEAGPFSKASEENVESINTFAFSVASELHKGTDESYVFSPASMAFLLGMLAEGAAGETRSEICRTMSIDDQDQVSVNVFCRDLNVLSSKGYDLDFASIALFDKSIRVKDKYCQTIGNYYDADAVNLDFGNTAVVTEFVNNWIRTKTKGRITRLQDGPIDCIALFMSSLFFKGSWKTGFNERMSCMENFIGDGGNVRRVRMMKRNAAEGLLGYYENELFQMVNMEYESSEESAGSSISMSVMLPKEGISIAKLIQSLDGQTLKTSQSSLKDNIVVLTLPVFNIQGDNDMKSVLEELGIKRMFNSSADFSNMSDDDFAVSKIGQVINISVDEKGTEAAAVSYAEMAATDNGEDHGAPPVYYFIANRPFLFTITEKVTGIMLFLGCYR